MTAEPSDRRDLEEPEPEAAPSLGRSRILEAAVDLVARSGSEALGVRRIARQAKVSPALVNHHFADRAGLLDAVLETVYRDIAALAREVLEAASSEADLSEVVALAVRQSYRLICANRELVRALLAQTVLAGQLDRARAEETQGPLLAAASELLHQRLRISRCAATLRVRTIVLLISRYAAFSELENERLTGLAGDKAAELIELHLVETAQCVLDCRP